jgi:hypothetical protein
MQVRYGVIWQRDDGPRAAGRLEFGPAEMRFEGLSGEGETVVDVAGYADVRVAEIARSEADRLDGRPALVLELHSNARIRIASAAQSMLLAEIADHVASLSF